MGRKCFAGSSLAHSTKSPLPLRVSKVGPGQCRHSPTAAWAADRDAVRVDCAHGHPVVAALGAPAPGRDRMRVRRLATAGSAADRRIRASGWSGSRTFRELQRRRRRGTAADASRQANRRCAAERPRRDELRHCAGEIVDGLVVPTATRRLTTSPVLGSRTISGSPTLAAGSVKSNMLSMELAMASNEPCPIRWPSSQLSSIKRRTEVWSVRCGPRSSSWPRARSPAAASAGRSRSGPAHAVSPVSMPGSAAVAVAAGAGAGEHIRRGGGLVHDRAIW